MYIYYKVNLIMSLEPMITNKTVVQGIINMSL